MAPFIARAIIWLIFAFILFDIIREVNKLFDLYINPYFAIVPAVLNFLFGEYMLKRWKFSQEAQRKQTTESRIDNILVLVGFILGGSVALCVIVVWALLIYNQTISEDKYTVSGEVKFPKSTGEIHVWLKTRGEIEKWGEPAPPARSLMIKPTPQELKAKKSLLSLAKSQDVFIVLFAFKI